MENNSFVIERTFTVLLPTVWEAITSKEQMKKWYFDFKEFKPEVGFQFDFFGGPDDRQYHHVCKITTVTPLKKLAYSWRYEGHEGNSLVTFELFEEGDATRLKLTHEGLETFPANNPDFEKENFVGGWTEIIGTSLKEFLEKK